MSPFILRRITTRIRCEPSSLLLRRGDTYPVVGNLRANRGSSPGDTEHVHVLQVPSNQQQPLEDRQVLAIGVTFAEESSAGSLPLGAVLARLGRKDEKFGHSGMADDLRLALVQLAERG